VFDGCKLDCWRYKPANRVEEIWESGPRALIPLDTILEDLYLQQDRTRTREGEREELRERRTFRL